jgi:ferredoxin-like protein FixX
MDRLWDRVEGDTSGCWIWTGSSTGTYGVIKVDGKQVYVHRLAYELLVGPIPEGMTIDHLCLVELCCNPTHMEVVTRAENQRRAKALVVACPAGHLYDEANTYITSTGARECRTCNRIRALARYHERKKAA